MLSTKRDTGFSNQAFSSYIANIGLCCDGACRPTGRMNSLAQKKKEKKGKERRKEGTERKKEEGRNHSLSPSLVM